MLALTGVQTPCARSLHFVLDWAANAQLMEECFLFACFLYIHEYFWQYFIFLWSIRYMHMSCIVDIQCILIHVFVHICTYMHTAKPLMRENWSQKTAWKMKNCRFCLDKGEVKSQTIEMRNMKLSLECSLVENFSSWTGSSSRYH